MISVENIKNKIDEIAGLATSTAEKLQQICDFLQSEIPHYHWVGFYFRNGNKEELKLAQFAGHPTEHTIIPFGKGICGQVAVSNKNFVVPDVTKQSNYISCGWQVKSEIVIPIFVDGKNIGQIDIDSHVINPFTNKDEHLLEYVCEKVSDIIKTA